MARCIRCAHCKQLLPEDDFALNVSEPSGRQHECRECRKRYYREDFVHQEQIDPETVEQIRCPRCGRILPASEFQINAARPNGRQWVCTTCKREYQRAHYANSAEQRQNIRHHTERRRQELLDYLYEYLLNHPCTMCGESDPTVLAFHHTDSEEKEITISDALQNHYSQERLEREISRCIVLCYNCHGKVTAKERGWWREKRK